MTYEQARAEFHEYQSKQRLFQFATEAIQSFYDNGLTGDASMVMVQALAEIAAWAKEDKITRFDFPE